MIKCGHCQGHHRTVEGVRRCATGETYPCTWLIETWYPEDPHPTAVDCGATAWETDRGFQCEAGHEHVNAQTRHEEGWDYAADPGEAMGLARAGVIPFHMDGKIWM